MTKTWIQPKLVMGYIEVVGPDDEPGIPYDEAVIHLEGDEDSEIEVRCPGALRLAPIIVEAVNNHATLVKALKMARKRISYLGAACAGSSHFEANEKTFLPAIDEVLNAVVGGVAK